MKPLLICIAHHISNDERNKYLDAVVKNILDTYPKSTDIIIDVNKKDFALDKTYSNIRIAHHPDLAHPFDLTWCHRQHFLNHINDYEWVCYIEDDLLIPYPNFCFYQSQFNKLWPNYVPGFVRLERYNNKEYVVDITAQYPKNRYLHLGNEAYASFWQPYHATWSLPTSVLATCNTQQFLAIHPHTLMRREWGASYTIWTMNKQSLVNVVDHKINPLCYIYHLANNYSSCPATPHGKIEVDNVIK
jgi:hypothetical protein